MAMCDYELQRLARMQENQRKMQEMLKPKLEEANQLLKPNQAQRKPAFKRRDRESDYRCDVVPRKSSRVASQEPKNYCEQPELFQLVERVARAARAPSARAPRRTGGLGAGAWRTDLGWHPGMGQYPQEVQNRTARAADKKVEEIEAAGGVAAVKLMSFSQVAGGFWLQLPKAITNRMPFTTSTYIPLVLGEDLHRVVYLPRPGNCNAGLSGGWREFAINHVLFPHDVVVFEKEEFPESTWSKLGLRIHIYRGKDYAKDEEEMQMPEGQELMMLRSTAGPEPAAASGAGAAAKNKAKAAGSKKPAAGKRKASEELDSLSSESSEGASDSDKDSGEVVLQAAVEPDGMLPVSSSTGRRVMRHARAAHAGANKKPAQPATNAAANKQPALPVTNAAAKTKPARPVTNAAATKKLAQPVTTAAAKKKPQGAAKKVKAMDVAFKSNVGGAAMTDRGNDLSDEEEDEQPLTQLAGSQPAGSDHTSGDLPDVINNNNNIKNKHSSCPDAPPAVAVAAPTVPTADGGRRPRSVAIKHIVPKGGNPRKPNAPASFGSTSAAARSAAASKAAAVAVAPPRPASPEATAARPATSKGTAAVAVAVEKGASAAAVQQVESRQCEEQEAAERVDRPPPADLQEEAQQPPAQQQQQGNSGADPIGVVQNEAGGKANNSNGSREARQNLRLRVVMKHDAKKQGQGERTKSASTSDAPSQAATKQQQTQAKPPKQPEGAGSAKTKAAAATVQGKAQAAVVEAPQETEELWHLGQLEYDEEGNEIFNVFEVLDYDKVEKRFKIRWWGYGPEHDTWERVTSLDKHPATYPWRIPIPPAVQRMKYP